MIVVAGEALIDMSALTLADGATVWRPRPGGSPMNVAVGLARLGQEVAFLGRISTDRFGQQLVGHLETEGIDTRWLQRGPEPTALAFVHVTDGGEPAYEFRWEGTADRMLTRADAAISTEATALHVGSMSLTLPPGDRAMESLVERHAGKVLISLDPNVRSFVPDRREYRHRLEDLMAAVDVVHVSTADLVWLYPPAKPDAVAHWWLALGAGLVVISDGERGATAYTAAREVVGPGAPADPLVDTVGAGDAFTSAMLSWLARRDMLDRAALESLGQTSLSDLLSFANRVAAITCTRVGADPPRRSEL